LPIARLEHQAEFCAAFKLGLPGASAEEDREVFGVCASPNYHGHNYMLTTVVEGEVDSSTGMVMDLMALDEEIGNLLMEVDHCNLNVDVPFLKGINPTSENLCIEFWTRIAPRLPEGVRLMELRLRESRDHAVIYRGPDRD